MALMASMMVFGVTGCGNTSSTSDSDEPKTTQENDSSSDTGSNIDELGRMKVAETVLQKGEPEVGEEIAIVHTSIGDIKLRFYPNQAPKAVENFTTLAKDGYYDGIIFHRVIENFMIQGGDPTGTGTGGESIYGGPFEDEISPNLHFFKGALAMANSGPNTNGSQFFIVQNSEAEPSQIKMIRDAIADNADDPLIIPLTTGDYALDELFSEEALEFYEEVGGHVSLEAAFGNAYTIFGQAFEGLDVVDAIAIVETNGTDKPLEDIIIEGITFEAYVK